MTMEKQIQVCEKVIFIRHGKTAGNERRAYVGRTDEPLSELGRRELLQRKEAGEYPNENQVAAVFVSPMLRCRQSAEVLFPNAGQIIIPEWTEMDFGDFEGKNYEQLNGTPAYQEWIDSNGTLPFPGGESRPHFVERVMKGYERMKEILARGISDAEQVCPDEQQGRWLGEEHQNAGSQVVAIVHGGTIMALFSTLYGDNYYNYQLENGAQKKLKELL
jgi:alpha-ribazole phosphatase